MGEYLIYLGSIYLYYYLFIQAFIQEMGEGVQFIYTYIRVHIYYCTSIREFETMHKGTDNRAKIHRECLLLCIYICIQLCLYTYIHIYVIYNNGRSTATAADEIGYCARAAPRSSMRRTYMRATISTAAYYNAYIPYTTVVVVPVYFTMVQIGFVKIHILTTAAAHYNNNCTYV